MDSKEEEAKRQELSKKLEEAEEPTGQPVGQQEKEKLEEEGQPVGQPVEAETEAGTGQPVDVAPEEKNELPIKEAGILTYNNGKIKVKKTTQEDFNNFGTSEIELEKKETQDILTEIIENVEKQKNQEESSATSLGGSKKRSLKKNKKHHKNTKKHKRTKQRRHKGKNKTLRK